MTDKKLCTCGKCGLVYQDTDPDSESNEYPAELIAKFNIKELKAVQLPGNKTAYHCPVCKTDEHIRPNVKPLVYSSKRIYSAYVTMAKATAL